MQVFVMKGTVKIEIGCPFFTLFDLYRTDLFDEGVLLTQYLIAIGTVFMYPLLTAYVHVKKA
jgi:hypothetical protein